jgi:hypothetical protein
MREGRQVIDSFASFDNDAAALSAIASVRPTLGHIPLAPKAHTAITAASGLKFNLATINKHVLSFNGSKIASLGQPHSTEFGHFLDAPKSGDFGYGHSQ